MQLRVNQSGPCRDPRFDHEDCPARFDTARRLREKTSRPREVMQDVRHHDGAETMIRKGQGMCVQYDRNVRHWKHIGGHQIGNVLAQEPRARAELQNRTWNFREGSRQGRIPLVIDPPEKLLVADNGAAQLGGARIIDIEAARQGVSQPTL